MGLTFSHAVPNLQTELHSWNPRFLDLTKEADAGSAELGGSSFVFFVIRLAFS